MIVDQHDELSLDAPTPEQNTSGCDRPGRHHTKRKSLFRVGGLPLTAGMNDGEDLDALSLGRFSRSFTVSKITG